MSNQRDESEADDDEGPLDEPDYREYWRRNLRLIGILFAAWFAVSFLAAILLAEPLYEVPLGNVPLSFWFAQQGSIIAFVIIIWIYVWRMNKLDREFGVED